MIDSTAPLHMVHYNTVLIVWFFFFFSLFPALLIHSLHGMNTTHFRIGYSVIFFLSLIAHCVAACHLPCPVFKPYCGEKELLTFMCTSVAHITPWEYLTNFFFSPLRGGVCYCLYQLHSGSIRRLKFGSEKQNLNFLTAL